MQPIQVKDVQTSHSSAIVVFGDTSGFSTFARRNFETRERVGELTMLLFNAFFRYQSQTMGSMKLKGDGFMSVHVVTPGEESGRTNQILSAAERLSKECLITIKNFPSPRPDSFRIRIAGGGVGRLLISMTEPPKCGIALCERNTIEDWFGYPLVLGARMLEMDRSVPLVCCQVIREWAGDSVFSFKKLPEERRVPSGIFAEDVRDLFSFRSEQGEPF